jgi:outer membrane protein OmpA-like peptidoglycan-associated protein
MRIFKRIRTELIVVTMLVGLMLASCNGRISQLPFLTSPESAEIMNPALGRYLHGEYNAMAATVRAQGLRERDVNILAEKASEAVRGNSVFPLNPREFRFDDEEMDVFVEAHLWLLDALVFMSAPEGNIELLAIAQTRFDCWVVSQSSARDAESSNECRDGFYDALALLTMPEEDQTIYAVYFDSGSTTLDQAAYDLAWPFADKYGERFAWRVYLSGFTDNTGSKSANKTLAMRRGIAVRNLLAQNGMPIDRIVIDAEGEAGEGEDASTARRVEIRAEPIYILHKDKRDRPQGWSHAAVRVN